MTRIKDTKQKNPNARTYATIQLRVSESEFQAVGKQAKKDKVKITTLVRYYMIQGLVKDQGTVKS